MTAMTAGTYSPDYATAQMRAVLPALQSALDSLTSADTRVRDVRNYQAERPEGDRDLTPAQQVLMGEAYDLASAVSALAMGIAGRLT